MQRVRANRAYHLLRVTNSKGMASTLALIRAASMDLNLVGLVDTKAVNRAAMVDTAGSASHTTNTGEEDGEPAMATRTVDMAVTISI